MRGILNSHAELNSINDVCVVCCALCIGLGDGILQVIWILNQVYPNNIRVLLEFRQFQATRWQATKSRDRARPHLPHYYHHGRATEPIESQKHSSASSCFDAAAAGCGDLHQNNVNSYCCVASAVGQCHPARDWLYAAAPPATTVSCASSATTSTTTTGDIPGGRRILNMQQVVDPFAIFQ